MPSALLELLRFTIGAAALALPGVWGVSALFPEKPLRERLPLGFALGLAAAVYLAVGLAYVRLWFFYPAWLLLALLTLTAWSRRRRRPSIWARPSGRDWLVVAVLSLVALSRFAVALRHDLPPGWDASFHLILARKIATTGRMIFDWRPFEDIALNYPVGSHAIVVVVSQLTGIPLHAAFRLLIPALGVVTTALVYVLARKVSDREEVGILSALAYGLWAVDGSIDYYRWGGLPNLLGMMFMVGALLLLLDRSTGRREAAAFALLFTAIFFTHHHVMITSGVVFAALFAYFLVSDAASNRHRAIFLGLLGSAVLGSFYILPYALKASSLGATGTLTFNEMFYDVPVIAQSVGVAFFIASLAGILVHRFARKTTSQLGVLYVVSGTLLGLFAFFEYGWRAISPRLYGDSFVAFTPSRFLTDLVYFSSVFAGYALYQLHRWSRIPFVLVFALSLPLAATNRTAWAKAGVVSASPELVGIYRWIDRVTPPDSLVLTDDRWAVYSTWRRCSRTPIPISEPSAQNTPKARLFDALNRGEIPPEAAGLKIIQIARRNAKILPGRLVWRTPSGVTVVDLSPGIPWSARR